MEEEKQNYTIILRHDTSTMWLVNDPILALGEYGVEDDTHKVKRGNGESKWSELTYEDFGLQYIVTYANLSGEITDNEALSNMFAEKLSVNVFDDVNGSILSNLKVNTTEVDGIAQVIKTTKNIQTGTTSTSNLTIQSEDNTIQGYWSMDKSGNRILNVIAVCSITDYQPSHRYYKDQLCYYNNKLYRAYRDIDADKTFNEGQWVLLASLHANDIEYDNLVSGLDATNVKDALDELKRRDDRKLPKSTEPNSVYGTSDLGEQRMIPIDDLRKVDTVNRKQADLNKNVQLDASEINYSDANPELGSIRKVLDSKVDKNFAGEGAKIVRDIDINYNDETGTLELVEDKVNPANGESGREVREIDIVSEKELAKNVKTINSRIDTEVETLNGTIDTTKTELDDKIEANKTDIEQKLEEAKTELKHNIDINDDEINGRVTNEVATLNNRIDEEVATLNNTIVEKENNVNAKIDEEIATVNETISGNKTDIEQKLANGLDTKIDKDIADNILTDISASQQSQEPTLKIVRKNTSSKEAIVTHIHFKAVGNIKTSYSSDDHILIDSTEIDNALTEHNRRLDNAEGRLSAHDTNIAALEEHDVNHDKLLATHSEQIANHETRMASLETRADGFDTSIADLDSKIENETTNRKVADAKLETDISRNALNIENNTQAIRDNADNITELNNLLQQNVTNLTQSKVDKTFAEATNNMIVGNIDYSEPTGNELLKVNKTLVSPVDGSHNVTGFKILSSDNTVVAKPIMEEETLVGIDIATNLDTDVNYFVTSEILNTTIPSDNTVTLSSLTATDKQTVEVQDIISDSEGTWARVKSIDTEAGTCVAVTFHKHAQAVWGTVKGNIDDQIDLKTKLDEKLNISSFREFNHIIWENKISGNASAITFSVGSADIKTNGGSGNSSRVVYKLRVDKDNSIQLTPEGQEDFYIGVNAENVVFDPQESGLTSELLAPAIRELKTLNDSSVETLNDTILEKETSLTELITQKETSLTANINNVNTTLSGQITNLENNKLNKNTEQNKIYGTDDSGEQTTYDKSSFGSVDSVNGINAIDKNISITGANIALNDSDERTLENVIIAQTNIVTAITNELQTQFTEYTPDTVFTIGTYVKTKFATFVRDDGIMLMAKVLKAFTADNTHETPYECFEYDIEQGNLKLIGIPEQIGGGNTPTPPHTGDVVDSVVDIDSNLSAVVSHTTEGGLNGTKYIDITNSSNESQTVLSDTWEMPYNIVEKGNTITATNTDDELLANEIDKSYITSNFEVMSTNQYGQDVMTVLNQVNGVEDEYTELGGTEQEISGILDTILGN